jgi:hypothetical protein
MKDIEEKIEVASREFRAIAVLEEEAYQYLKKNI